MNFETPVNSNYCAIVVALDKFVDLPNCDNVKAAIIFGNSIIVGKEQQPGDIGLFFPVETALDPSFLGPNNLYRKTEFGNVDPEKKGFFEAHGRVKTMKFRGHKSEGFWIPIESLYNAYPILISEHPSEFPVGTEFDKIGDQIVCKKYVPKGNPPGLQRPGGPKKAKLADKIVGGQFRFHIDTANLRRNIHRINPGDVISITDKWHGTSVICGNLLTKKDLKWYEKLLQKIGVKIQDTEYAYTWSSRRVIKGVGGKSKADSVHYYNEDVWGIVAQEIKEVVPKGITIYGEIVGYTPEGGMIQKGYHYGCVPTHHQLRVYRITSTNVDGQVVEFSWPQLKEFCAKFGLQHVVELYYGKAGDIGYKHDDVEFFQNANAEWSDLFLSFLEHYYVNDKMCPFNNKEVPAEGIVVRVDHLDSVESFKLKSFKFLKHESDELDSADAVDIEAIEV